MNANQESYQGLASFPVPRPAFRRCNSPLYRTKQRRKAGRGTGYEANQGLSIYLSHNHISMGICLFHVSPYRNRKYYASVEHKSNMLLGRVAQSCA